MPLSKMCWYWLNSDPTRNLIGQPALTPKRTRVCVSPNLSHFTAAVLPKCFPRNILTTCVCYTHLHTPKYPNTHLHTPTPTHPHPHHHRYHHTPPLHAQSVELSPKDETWAKFLLAVVFHPSSLVTYQVFGSFKLIWTWLHDDFVIILRRRLFWPKSLDWVAKTTHWGNFS